MNTYQDFVRHFTELRDGCHGISEARAAATYLLDSTDENSADEMDMSWPEYAAWMLTNLAEAAKSTANGVTRAGAAADPGVPPEGS